MKRRRTSPADKPPRRLRSRQPRARRRGMVRIVDAYLFREAFQLYVIGFGGFLLFLVVNQLFLEGDRLLNPNFPAKEILRLIALNIPYYITMAIPIAVLFGTMMTMGRLAKDNEIDALFTNGIHLVRLYMPFLILSLVNVIIVFMVNEALVPRANAEAEHIYKKYPYLREQQETELDPVIVSLPNGAFFAASFVDKNTGSAFYAVYDTLTKKSLEPVDAPPLGPQAPPSPLTGEAPPLPGAQPAQPPAHPQQPITITPGEDRPPPIRTKPIPNERPVPRQDSVRPREGASAVTPDNAITTSAELAQVSASRPPGNAEPPGSTEAPVRRPAPAAPPRPSQETPAKPGAELSVTAQGAGSPNDLRLFLSANGQISEETLTVSQPFVYYLSSDGLISHRERETIANLRLGIPLREVFTEIRTPEELSREELARQTEVKRQLGANPAKDATDFFLKFSIPFACLFLSLVAMPLSLRAPRDERLLGLVITFVLVMSYYTVYYICKLMGYNEILPPFLAAWMQNIIYAGIAVVIFTISRK